MSLLLNYTKIELNRITRLLVEWGYEKYPGVQAFLSGVESFCGPTITAQVLDVLAAIINNPEWAKKIVISWTGQPVGDKVNDIIDEFIDEFFEKVRDLWLAHGTNVPEAEYQKLNKMRSVTSFRTFHDTMLLLDEKRRGRILELVASLETTGEFSEKKRFAIYRPRLNGLRAIAAMLDASGYNPTDAQRTGPITALQGLQTAAKSRMFQYLETMYGEAKPPMYQDVWGGIKKAGTFVAEKAKIVVGNPEVELPQLAQKITDASTKMNSLRDQINARRLARK